MDATVAPQTVATRPPASPSIEPIENHPEATSDLDAAESTSPNDDTGYSIEDSPENEGIVVLPADKAGVPLTLSDFFNPASDWSENRFDVADRGNVSGVSSKINSCLTSADGAEFLELRLANHFEGLDFKVGQGNQSESSDQTLVVRVSGNNKQLDVQKIAFNEIREFSINATDVNATRIEMYLDNNSSDCGGSIQAVLYDVVLH